MIDYGRLYVCTMAGFFGILGFLVTYASLGWLFEPIQEWIEERMEGLQ